jgi:hypothetical protein
MMMKKKEVFFLEVHLVVEREQRVKDMVVDEMELKTMEWIKEDVMYPYRMDRVLVVASSYSY